MALRCCERPRTAVQGLASLCEALAPRCIGLVSLRTALARQHIGLVSLRTALARQRIGLVSLHTALTQRAPFRPRLSAGLGVTRPTLSRCLGEGWPWRDAEESPAEILLEYDSGG